MLCQAFPKAAMSSASPSLWKKGQNPGVFFLNSLLKYVHFTVLSNRSAFTSPIWDKLLEVHKGRGWFLGGRYHANITNTVFPAGLLNGV